MSEDKSVFMKWKNESVKLLIMLYQVHKAKRAAMFSFQRTRSSLVMTIPNSYGNCVSTENGWKSDLLQNLNRFNLNWLWLK